MTGQSKEGKRAVFPTHPYQIPAQLPRLCYYYLSFFFKNNHDSVFPGKTPKRSTPFYFLIFTKFKGVNYATS